MVIICHYGEIGLKGKNRGFFEKKLVENIKLALRSAGLVFETVGRISGRILIRGLPSERFSEGSPRQIKKVLANVFGLTYFSFAQECGQNIELIKKTALKILTGSFSDDRRKMNQLGTTKTFKIETKRSEKNLPLTSQQINEQVGEYILKKLKAQNAKPKNTNQKPKVKVNLKNPDLTIFIEIVEKYAFLYTKKIPGPGGLPVGISGKAVALLSGGIDSPVASYLAMKRGLELNYVHFHALPYTNKASIDKVKNLVKILGKFHSKTKLFLIPFADIQKQIVLNCPAKLRIVLYRRMMLRIAEKIAEEEKARALVSGENLGQVASQTLENISVIAKAIDLPVLRPLLGFDKQEIINLAKQIKTYDTSILPYDDCCSRFVPKHPETKAALKEVERAEKNLDIKKLVEQALKNSSLKQ